MQAAQEARRHAACTLLSGLLQAHWRDHGRSLELYCQQEHAALIQQVCSADYLPSTPR